MGHAGTPSHPDPEPGRTRVLAIKSSLGRLTLPTTLHHYVGDKLAGFFGRG